MIGSINEAKITLVKEMSQVLGDRESPLGVPPSSLMPELSEEVSQARRDWPSHQVASEAVYTMPRSTPSIVRKRRLAGPGFWDTLVGSIKKDWKWWLGGSIALVIVVAVIAGGGKK